MKEFSTKYMYDNEWTEKASKFFSKDHIEKTKPYVVKVKNGIILPERPGDLPWGLGGCLDEAGNLIPESTVNGAYGGKYNFDENSIEKLDETVVLIPMIPKHWGHFIIDVISRLWIFLDDRFDTKNLKIYYCAFGWGEKKLSGNYLRFMEYLGIADRLIQVDHPIQAKEVWVPSFTMSYRISCNEEYKVPVEYVIQKVLASDKVKNLEPYEKIYFTRTHFATSQLKEIGEIDIEKTMQSNGYHILSPEKLNFEEQIYYIHQCKVMMAMQKREQLYLTGISATIKTIISILVFLVVDLLTHNIIVGFCAVICVWIAILFICDLPWSKASVKPHFNIQKINVLFKRGFYSFAFLFLSVYLANVTKYALDGRVESSSQAMYGIVLMPATLISLCCLYILQPSINHLSNQYVEKNYHQFRTSVRKIFSLIGGLAILALAAATVIGIPVLNLVYGVDLSDYKLCLQLIVVGASMNAAITLLSTALTIMYKTKFQFYIYVFVSVFAFFISGLLVNVCGVLGSAISYFVIMCVQLGLFMGMFYTS